MKYTLIVIFTLIATITFAQHDDKCSMREKIKSEKIAYITEKLDLTVKEAQVFWPVYNELETKRKAIRSERRKAMHSLKKEYETLSDKELEVISDKLIHLEVDYAQLMKEYNQKFKKVLPANKIVKYYRAEHEFKSKLLKDLKGHHKSCPEIKE